MYPGMRPNATLRPGAFAMTELRKITLHTDVHAGNGPFLLLVHGFLSGRSQWGPNLGALSRVCRPVVVELWGHGRSPSPDDTALYHPDAYVEAFEQLRQELGAARWFICGQSLGGALTLRYSLTHPERLMAQIFTNSNAGLADAEWIAARRTSALQQAEAIEQNGRDALEALPVHPIRSRRLPAEAKAALLEDAALHNPRGIARTLRYTTLNAPVAERVCDIRVPTLLVCGERERRFAPRRVFAEREIPGLIVVGVEAGHAVNIEAAEVFNRAAVDFIRHHS
jgi:pimeloyl-ACP methyl ester carboxylesterase